MASDQHFGIAAFGLGKMGTIHFVNLVENVRANLLYVVHTDTKKARDLVEKYHVSETVKVIKPEENQQVFEDDRVHGIVISSPTSTHEEIVLKSLKHGKAVFCEKPISDTTEGAAVCCKEAERTGVPLFCAFNRRFDPSLMELRQRIMNGEIGDVHFVKTCSRSDSLPTLKSLKVNGNMFHVSAIHDVDLICWLLQDYPVSVYSAASAHNKEYAALGNVDTIAIVMKFANGTLCTVDLSWHSVYGYDQRIEVLGSKGMLQSANQPTTSVVGYSGAGVTGAQPKQSYPKRYAESYKIILDHFLDILDGKPLLVKSIEFLKVTKILSASEESYHTGQPVTLTWD